MLCVCLYIHTWWLNIYIYVSVYIHTYISTYECIYIHIHTRMAQDDDGPPHNPRHMLDTARVCERMRVYVYLVDGLYRRAELNKHPHCSRVPATARPQQRCPAVFLRALARHYSIEVNWIWWERARARVHVHLSIHAYVHTYANVTCVCRCSKKKNVEKDCL